MKYCKIINISIIDLKKPNQGFRIHVLLAQVSLNYNCLPYLLLGTSDYWY